MLRTRENRNTPAHDTCEDNEVLRRWGAVWKGSPLTDKMRFSIAATMLGAAAGESTAVSAASMVKLLIFAFIADVRSASWDMYSSRNASKALLSAAILPYAIRYSESPTIAAMANRVHCSKVRLVQTDDGGYLLLLSFALKSCLQVCMRHVRS